MERLQGRTILLYETQNIAYATHAACVLGLRVAMRPLVRLPRPCHLLFLKELWIAAFVFADLQKVHQLKIFWMHMTKA